MQIHKLQFKFRYAPAIADGKREYDPVLHCYMSQNVKNVTPFIQKVKFEKNELLYINRPKNNDPFSHKEHYHGVKEKGDKNKWYNNIEFDQKVEFTWSDQNFANNNQQSNTTQMLDLKINCDTTINFDLFTHTYNKKGEKCLNEAGSCSVFLYELYYYLSQDPKKVLYLKKPLIVYNADRMFKGLIYMELDDSMITNGNGQPLKREDIFNPVSEYDYMGDNKKVFDETFKRFITSNYSVFSKQNSQPTWEFMRNIHSPMYRFRGIISPGLCFILLNRDSRCKNTERYYINLLEITLRRHYPDKDLKDAMQYLINSASDREVAVIHAKLVCIFSNYCKYMTDKVQITSMENIDKDDMKAEFKYMNEKHDRLISEHHLDQQKKQRDSFDNSTKVESFFTEGAYRQDLKTYDQEYQRYASQILDNQQVTKHSPNVSKYVADQVNEFKHVKLIESFSVWLRMTMTGDCEDMGREILRHDYDIKTSEFTHPGLQRLQHIRKKYFAFQTLKGVSSAAVTDDIDELEDMNAHMDITLIPAKYCLDLMRNFNSTTPLFEDESELFDNDKQNQEPLETLICEGTGILNPNSDDPGNQMCKSYVMKGFQDAFKDLRSTIFQNLKEKSSFYKTIQSALVYDFIYAGYGIGEVVFYQNQDPRGTMLKQLANNTFNKDYKNYTSTVSKEQDSGTNVDEIIDFGISSEIKHKTLRLNKKIQSKRQTTQTEEHQHFDDVCGKSKDSHSQLPHIADEMLKQYHSTSTGDTKKTYAPTHGIRHVDIINQNTDDIMLYTMPDITKDELIRFERVLQQNHPVPGMDAPEFIASQWEDDKEGVRGKIGNIYLEKLCAVARQQKRNFNFITEFQYVDFYLRQDQIDEKRCNRLIELVKEKKYIVDVKYYSEQLTKHHKNYLLRFKCIPVRVIF